MPKAAQAPLMAKRKKPASRPSPGGPGGMDALRRAQEKLKAMGIKPWKPAPPPAPKKAAQLPAPEPAVAPVEKAAAAKPKGAPAAAKRGAKAAPTTKRR